MTSTDFKTTTSMKKYLLTLLALCVWSLDSTAQKGAWGEFPMVPNRSFAARAAAATKIKGTPEHEKALAVYERLCEARGDFRYPVPDFYLTSKQTVAEIQYEENSIYLGEKAFAVCESFGAESEAALAFLLGHELTHYYEKHAWRGNFSADNSELSIMKTLDSLFQDILKSADRSLRPKLLRFDTLAHQLAEIELEAQSDYLGGFLAYSAGYGNFNRGDELIRRLYKEFELPAEMPGYVTRSEREAMSRQSAERMNDLVEIFEMANLLTATGQYEEAYRFYRKVLVEYQSREVYNNVGAAAMLQSLKFFTANELRFRYPIQLDLEMANSRGPEEEAARNKLLQQAILHFDAAISLDPNYAPAYLNKACAFALLGDQARAYFYADVEARAASKGKYQNLLVDVEILLGILDARAGNEASAKDRLQTAAQTDKKGLATYNLSVLNNAPPPPAPEAPEAPIDDESIDNQNVFMIMFPEQDKVMAIDEVLGFHQNTKQGKHSRLYFSRRFSKLSAVFHATNPGYPGETARGIRIGQSMADIEKAHGRASRSIATPTGQILAYPEVLYIMNEDKLERWVLYKIH